MTGIFALFDADASGKLAGDRVVGSAGTDDDRAPERRLAGHRDARPGEQAELAEVPKQLAVGVGDPPHGGGGAGLDVGERALRCAWSSSSSALGIGSPCGSCVGKPSEASISASSSSESACSSRSASACTASRGRPSCVERYCSSSLWWRIISIATSSPRLGQARSAVGLVLGQAELGELLQHRGRRGGRDAHPAGERGGRGTAAGLELVQLLHVVLDGRGEACGLAQGLSNIQFSHDKIQPEEASRGRCAPPRRRPAGPGRVRRDRALRDARGPRPRARPRGPCRDDRERGAVDRAEPARSTRC